MLKRNNILSILLAFILIVSNTIVLAEELVPEVQPALMDSGLSIPERDASSWALDELVDSDRYGFYKAEDIYKNNLRSELNDELKENLLKGFRVKLEGTNLEKIEKLQFITEVKNSKTRGGFVKELYNILTSYENEENLRKDPIIYLNHVGILRGSGKDLFLDRNITVEEGILFIKRAVDYIYRENNLDSKGLMWKVENKGNVVYLLGSIHYGKPEIYPFRNEILKNFAESEMLFVEVDISNQEELMRVMMEKMEELEEEMEKASKYEDGTTLKSQIDEEMYSKIERIMKKHDILEEEYVDFKISGVSQKLSEIFMDEIFTDFPDEFDEEFQAGFEAEMAELMDNELMKLMIEGPKLGLDFYFLDKAKTLDKNIGELESMESQMELLFGQGGLFGEVEGEGEGSEEYEIDILKDILQSFDNEGNILEIKEAEDEEFQAEFEAEMEKAFEEQLNEIEGMFDAIKVGDAERLAEIFIESEGAKMFGGQLLGERDKNMARKIGNLLEGEEEETYFIVVGAAHFVVDGTIIDNLREMGYRVERLN